MLRILTTIADNIRAEFTMTAIERRWRKAKVPTWRFAAAKEVAMRAELEAFRDFATAQFEQSEATVDDIKAKWMKSALPPLTAAIGTERATMLKSVVDDMPPSEMFHPDAYRAWCAKADALTAAHRKRGSSSTMRRVLVGGGR